MNFDQFRKAARAEYLDLFGGLHEDGSTLILLGPYEPGYWTHIQNSPEWRDGQADPIDRWSTRVISKLAHDFGGLAHFPFGGAPFKPFISWALKSKSAWQSPVALLVHETAGLMVSYRGAIEIPQLWTLSKPGPNPCETCDTQPCLSACPSGALSAKGYDVPTCHAYLDTQDGAANLNQGCNVRRSCPVSQSYGRLEAHSAYHMSIFHK